jgi:hypothetical protein
MISWRSSERDGRSIVIRKRYWKKHFLPATGINKGVQQYTASFDVQRQLNPQHNKAKGKQERLHFPGEHALPRNDGQNGQHGNEQETTTKV